jgi:hypothetical protein
MPLGCDPNGHNRLLATRDGEQGVQGPKTGLVIGWWLKKEGALLCHGSNDLLNGQA